MNKEPLDASQNSEQLVERYEALRARAVGSCASNGPDLHGRATMMRYGMAAWMRVCGRAMTERSVLPKMQEPIAGRVPSGHWAALLNTLVGMALSHPGTHNG